MGKLIVIEGLDGSGKATQTKYLLDALQRQGQKTMAITFPRYENDSSALVRQYLAGEFGKSADDVNAYAASTFYSVDRFASYKTLWGDFYAAGGVVIADRYTTSNAVHQCAKLPTEEWDAYLQWLFEFEYKKIGIPTPDLVVYLDVDPTLSQGLMSQRYGGDESKKDIHERDAAYLQRSRKGALYCAEVLGWARVACGQNGALRTIEDIHEEILQMVHSVL